MPAREQAQFEVPGGPVTRGPLGEVPGGKWIRVASNRGTFGFASDALYNFDCKDDSFRATICRASRYADDVNTPPEHGPWRPAVDAGELKFRFLISPGDDRMPALAEELENPPVSLLVPPHKGKRERSGSLASIDPAGAVRVLAVKPAHRGKGVVIRLQVLSDRAIKPALHWLGQPIPLPEAPGGRISTFRLTRVDGKWKVARIDSTEL
jgi:alpha-mannosidase